MVHRHLGPSEGGVVHHQQQQIRGKVAQLQHWDVEVHVIPFMNERL